MSQSLVFPELVYPEIFVSKTENLKKRQQQQKPKKEGGAREVKLGSPLQNTQIKKKKNPLQTKQLSTGEAPHPQRGPDYQ